ncbi:MAG: bifunctional serine/threonine-protein kinase/formylglycine-generating enzyme family protein [Acidobacteriota bacterium]
MSHEREPPSDVPDDEAPTVIGRPADNETEETATVVGGPAAPSVSPGESDTAVARHAPWGAQGRHKAPRIAITRAISARRLPWLERDTGGEGMVSEGPGTATFTPKYSFGESLGEGGMGVVHGARDDDLRRRVALKVPKRLADEDLERFIDEARVMGQLDHPSIPPVHELGVTDDGRPYYTMPVLQGRTLRSVVEDLRRGDADTRRRWSISRLVQVFIRAAQAVAHAHSRGVLHRDLKPGNVMVGAHGEVQVLDWGLARLVKGSSIDTDLDGESRDRGLIMGSPVYMPPEQAAGRESDVRSDVYSLGALLYELLTLEPLFEGEAQDVLSRVATEIPVPPRKRAPSQSIPRALEGVVLMAVAKEPEDRQRTVEELIEQLEEWLQLVLDRERQLEVAEARCAEGRAALDRLPEIARELEQARIELNDVEQKTKGWWPVERKRPFWEAQDRFDQLRLEQQRLATVVLTSYTGALQVVPDHAPAREGLASYHWLRCQEAIVDADEAAEQFHLELLRTYDDGQHAAEIAGHAWLSLESDPPGAEVWLHELREESLVLRPQEPRLLGQTPLEKVALGMGSYLLVLESEGRRPTRYPIYLPRNGSWEGKVRLLSDAEIGRDFIHVPAGPFIEGGDPETQGWSLPLATREIDDVLIAKDPVTNGEYIEFLNALAEDDRLEEARARAPRIKPHLPETGYYDVEDGRFVFAPPDEQGDEFLPRYPVVGICHDDVMVYVEWRSKRDGIDYRLPDEHEWEKTARGVDGRFFPWGNRFDYSLANLAASRRDKPMFAEVDEFADDCSVYGVRGLAGNARDWTSTLITRGEGEGARTSAILRGGGWYFTPLFSRSACRYPCALQNVDVGIGFRLARNAPPRDED